jgi:putative oxidoreductase
MKGWNVALWFVQVFLAIMYVMAGLMMLIASYEKLNILLQWTQALPEVALRIIALCQLLGALGLVLPAILRIKPELTGYAAGALALMMLLSAIFHGMRGDVPNVVPSLILCGLSAFVAWGRLLKAPIEPRNAGTSG